MDVQSDFQRLVVTARKEFLGHARYESDSAEGQQTTWTAALAVVEQIGDFQECFGLYAGALSTVGAGGAMPWVVPLDGASQLETITILLASATKWQLDQDTDMLARGAGADQPAEDEPIEVVAVA